MNAFAKKSPFETLKIRDFSLLIAARFLMIIAVQMQMTTVGLQTYYQYTVNEPEKIRFYILGLIGLYEAIPFIINSFYSGHVADIFSRKKIIVISISVLSLGSFFLLLFNQNKFPFLNSYTFYPLLWSVALFGIVRAFIAASTPPLISKIVPRNLYTNATTWTTTVFHTASVLGPVVAGLIYGWNNEKNASLTYLINLILFIGSLILFSLIKEKGIPEKKEEESILKSLSAGIKFVFRHKIILSALSLDLFAVLFGGAVAMIPAFTDKILKMGPESAGVLRTAPALGAVIMAIILAFYPPQKNTGKWLLISVIAFGLFTICFGICTNYWLAFVFLALTGAFDNISVVIRHTILQLQTPENMRGRVSAVNGIFIGSSNEIGSYESGLAARIIGLVPSIIFGGCMVIGVVLGINMINPKLKNTEMKDLER
jgi:MFS family permease